jgi:hypothetical protein
LVDFVIVVTSLVSFFPLQIDLTKLKIFRMIRLLRPLRVINKSQNVRASIKVLVVSIPAIISLLVIVFFITFIFAIVGVNLLKGKSFYCDMVNNHSISAWEIETLITT